MQKTVAHAGLDDLDLNMVRAGFQKMLPISLFVMVWGAAFGLAATQTGLSAPWSIFMSAVVYAGAAQFAVLDMWGPHVPILTLAVTVFAINARHLLMGASLYPWLRNSSATKRYGVMLLVSDANWALAMQAFGRGQPGLGWLVGGGLALWSFWLVGTGLGTYFGGAIREPKSLGLDMVMGCFLLVMAIGGQKDLRMLCTWVVAAGSSLLAYRYLPANSHVVVGALAGGILGALWMEKSDEH
jgi:4-azaleucine resistance transporter AzlC